MISRLDRVRRAVAVLFALVVCLDDGPDGNAAARAGSRPRDRGAAGVGQDPLPQELRRSATATRGTAKATPRRICSPGRATSRRGKFKVRTTPNGALPTHQDLVNIIRRGMPYTSMPAWPDLSDQEVSDLAYYLKTFSPDFANAESVPKPMELPSAPAATSESIELGKKLYEETGCLKCHGKLGRGDGPSAPTLMDDLGHPIRAADLTQPWTFRGRSDPRGHLQDDDHGAQRHADAVVRRQPLTPEQRWAITDFIASLSGSDGPGYTNLVVAKHVAGSDRSDEGRRELRVRSGRPLSDHRTDHGARAPVPSSRHLRDGSGHLRRRVDRLPRSMARHERGQDGEERADASRADGGGGGGERRRAAPGAPSAIRKSPQPAAADPFAETDDRGSRRHPSSPTPSRSRFRRRCRRAPASPTSSSATRQNSVDLWFFDLARPDPLQFTGRGSADIAPNDTGDLTGVASYDQGEWSVIFKRPLRPSAGAPFVPGDVSAGRLLGLGRVLARAWQQARSHVLVLHLRRAGSRHIGRRPDGEDGADSFSSSSWP